MNCNGDIYRIVRDGEHRFSNGQAEQTEAAQ